jgi:translation initiation factor IF-3
VRPPPSAVSWNTASTSTRNPSARPRRRKTDGHSLQGFKFRPKTDEHDYQFKLKHIKRFLEEKNKVKVVIRFRGREIIHMDKGLEMLNRVREELGDLAAVESEPKAEGRTMVMMLAPK